MRNLEEEYLSKMRHQSLENQCLIMTIQSFNRLNQIAIRNNMPQCISSRQFTDALKEYCQV